MQRGRPFQRYRQPRGQPRVTQRPQQKYSVSYLEALHPSIINLFLNLSLNAERQTIPKISPVEGTTKSHSKTSTKIFYFLFRSSSTRSTSIHSPGSLLSRDHLYLSCLTET